MFYYFRKHIFIKLVFFKILKVFLFKKVKKAGVVDKFIFITILIILVVITISSLYLQIKKDLVNRDYVKLTFNVACDLSCKDITILSNQNSINFVKNLSLICNNSVKKTNLENLFSPNSFGYRLDLKLKKECFNLKLKGVDILSGKEKIYYIKQ